MIDRTALGSYQGEHGAVCKVKGMGAVVCGSAG